MVVGIIGLRKTIIVLHTCFILLFSLRWCGCVGRLSYEVELLWFEDVALRQMQMCEKGETRQKQTSKPNIT
jgi:hypothetical protein